MALPPVGSGQWSTGFCDCFQDCGSCKPSSCSHFLVLSWFIGFFFRLMKTWTAMRVHSLGDESYVTLGMRSILPWRLEDSDVRWSLSNWCFVVMTCGCEGWCSFCCPCVVVGRIAEIIDQGITCKLPYHHYILCALISLPINLALYGNLRLKWKYYMPRNNIEELTVLW